MARKGLSGLAAGAMVTAAFALAPASAQAHPCAVTWSLETATFLSANDASSAWAGSLPTMYGSDSDCAPAPVDLTAKRAYSSAAADDPAEATSTFTYTPNMRPVGYSARIPPVPSSLADINSDMAFKGNYMFQGHWSGFRVIDISDPANPVQVYNTEACRHTSGQGDVVVHGNILVRTWDAPATGAQAGATCAGQAVGSGFEGIHIWDISDPTNPVFKKQVRMASTGNEPGAPTGCGAHTATAVPDDARGNLYLYVGGSSGSCTGMDIVRISQADPSQATFLRRASAGRQCHDNNVIMGDINLAMCAGGNGFSVFKFDPTRDPDEAGTPEQPGGIANPTLLYSRQVPGVSIAHSGSFTYDGKVLIFGHEPGGGTGAQCQATSSVNNRTLFFFDPQTGTQLGSLLHPRPQASNENCTWHNFNVVPTYKGYYAVSGNYQSGVSVFDFTNPAAPEEIAYADPAPLSPNQTGGDWSTHFYNGRIYESDIRRGVIIWELDHDAMRRTRTVDLSNPQTQLGSFEQDLEGPEITIAAPVDGGEFLQNSVQNASFSCDDADSGVESCTGTVANGAALDTSTIGTHEFTVTATDKAGNETTQTVSYVVNSTAVEGEVGGSVSATLSLQLGSAASFGAFTPGIARDYTASTAANVVSSAGDATLTVSDPSAEHTGKLVNGAFALASPVHASATSAAGTAAPGGAVGGADAPTTLLTYAGPVSNDQATVTFTQSIGAGDALRTGSYSKTLTFTLSTTTP